MCPTVFPSYLLSLFLFFCLSVLLYFFVVVVTVECVAFVLLSVVPPSVLGLETDDP